MIKTLRITSVVAVVVAGVFFVFPVLFGARSDESLDEFLNSPSVIEEFRNATGNTAATEDSRVSPLVQQAKAFGLYLNPPEPERPSTPVGPEVRPIKPRPTVTPKFNVIGTSTCEDHPELSLALVDEPGKGLHWVRQASKVGHLSIEQIKDGLVVVKGSEGTFELVAEQIPQKNFLEEAPPVSARPSGRSVSRPAAGPSGRMRANIARRASRPTQPQRSAEEDARLEELITKLRSLRESSESDKTDSEPNDARKAELVEKLISNFKSSRVSAEEAEKLDDLGETLNGQEELE